MKLYDVPRESKLKYGEYLLDFHGIDGMYSRSTTEDGQVVFLAAWTPVVYSGGYYEVLSCLPCQDKIIEIDGHKYKLVKA